MRNDARGKSIPFTAFLLAALMAFMEISGLPAALFVKPRVADIDPMYFTLTANFAIAVCVCWLWRKFIAKDWNFGLQKRGAAEGIKKYGLPAAAATAVTAAAYCIGLYPFDNSPTVLKVVIEGFVYYIGVGIIEELYLRGLLQNTVTKIFGGGKHSALYAVLTVSALFGIGHISGAAGQPVVTIVCKVVWAFGLGVYFGSLYWRTGNLWVPVILHTVIDFAGVPFCFSTSNQYPAAALAASLVSFLSLGFYGIRIMLKENISGRRI